jgi:glycine/D-amino acid oxidase-like deaminating enzyme
MFPAILPTPDFGYDPAKPDFRAGIRPYRKTTYRLEPEQMGGQLVVHNYGHGGAGITMALGCAHEIRDIVSASGLAAVGTKVAVLGAGVMGLTAATLLREMGLDVSIHAKAFTNTTSDRAGGQWAPSVVEFEQTISGKQLFHRVLRRAFHGYEALIGKAHGVSRRPNYTWFRSASFDKVPSDLIPAPRSLPRLPFQGHSVPGFVYETLLVEPPILLNRLRHDLARAGVPMIVSDFTSPAQVSALPEPIIINCTGLGSGAIWPDPNLVPIRGQLVFLRPQPQLQYLYSGHGYIFPREDAVVVGGTYEEGVSDETPDPTKCEEIVRFAKAAFTGDMAMLAKVPPWLLTHK